MESQLQIADAQHEGSSQVLQKKKRLKQNAESGIIKKPFYWKCNDCDDMSDSESNKALFMIFESLRNVLNQRETSEHTGDSYRNELTQVKSEPSETNQNISEYAKSKEDNETRVNGDADDGD